MTDRDDLMQLFATGNRKAFTTVYEQQYAAIFYFAKGLLHDPDIAADIVADSFFKLWKLHEGFSNLLSIKSFLQVTTRNACFNYLRDTKSHDKAKKELLYLLSQESSEDVGDFGRHERKALFMTRMLEALKKLPRKCRRVFELAYLDGWSNHEIAAALRINEKTVRNHKSTAIALLRGLINEDEILEVVLFCCTAYIASNSPQLGVLYDRAVNLV
jgi:RNA polymerase sigma-70 factor (family 1)